MTDEFERKGIWWLPDKPERKLVGTLKYSPRDGGELELVGGFASLKELVDGVWVMAPSVILGVEQDGKKITLLHCVQKTWATGGGYAICSFSAQVVCMGAHYTTPQEMVFAGLWVHYSHLDEWANQSFFTFEEEGDLRRVTHTKPKEVLATIDDRAVVSVSSCRRERWHHTPTRAISIEYDAKIGFDLAHNATLSEYTRLVQTVQVFLALAVGEAVYPLHMTSTQPVQLPGGRTAASPVQIWLPSLRIPDAEREVSQNDMLFTLADIAGKFGPILNKWFENAELLEPVYNLYFGTMSAPMMSEEPRFLSLTQAMESFHRRRYAGAYLSRDEYTPVYERLLESIPQSVAGPHRDALKTRLFYGNEFSLRKRLEEIIDSHQELLGPIIGDRESFVFQVKQTRNYLTHYDEDIKNKGGVAEGADLFALRQQLASVLEVCLLSDLGFTGEELKRQVGIIKRRREVQRIDWS
jgi:hypothetical protein